MHYAELNHAWAELTGPGGAFEIVEMDVGGHWIRGFKNAPPSVREVWLSTAQFAERDYLVFGDERITYAEAHRQVASIANWLLAKGVQPGERVAVAMRNYPEWMLIYWAACSIGVAVVGMNAWWTAPELAFGLSDSRPKVVFAEAWIEGGGKSTVFMEGRLSDPAGKVLAKATSTLRLMERSRVEASAKAAIAGG